MATLLLKAHLPAAVEKILTMIVRAAGFIDSLDLASCAADAKARARAIGLHNLGNVVWVWRARARRGRRAGGAVRQSVREAVNQSVSE